MFDIFTCFYHAARKTPLKKTSISHVQPFTASIFSVHFYIAMFEIEGGSAPSSGLTLLFLSLFFHFICFQTSSTYHICASEFSPSSIAISTHGYEFDEVRERTVS